MIDDGKVSRGFQRRRLAHDENSAGEAVRDILGVKRGFADADGLGRRRVNLRKISPGVYPEPCRGVEMNIKYP